MIVGVDLDNCSAKYSKGLRSSMAPKLGVAPEDLLKAFPDPKDYSMSDWLGLGSPEAFKRYHCEAVEEGLYKTLEVMEGASETLHRLAADGHYLKIITSRFVRPGQHRKVVHDTTDWLEDNNIPYNEISFAADKTGVYADVYIDDAPYNVEALTGVGRKVIIFQAGYNSDTSLVLSDAQRALTARAADWDEVYAQLQCV